MELRNQEKARTIRMPGSSTSYPHHHSHNHRNPPDQSPRLEEGKFSSFIPPSSATAYAIPGAAENGRGVGGRQGGEDEDAAAIYTQTLAHRHHPPPRLGQGRRQEEEEGGGQQRKPRSDPADSADRAPPSIHRLHPDEQPPAPSINPTAAPPAATGSSDVSNLAGGSTSSMKKYTECQRNHAAHLGRYVVDGCGEFMPGGEAGTLKALLCAACDCHRNFHRQVLDGEDHVPATPFPPPTLTPAANTTTTTTILTSPPLQSPLIACSHLITPPAPLSSAYHHQHQRIGPTMMAFFGGGGAAESSSDDLNMFGVAQNHQHRQREGMLEFGSSGRGGSKKRFRTKFTQDQKDKMAEFAEKIGWRIQKQDDVELQEFCDQIGVRRRVFKVWMHNNKQSMKNKQ